MTRYDTRGPGVVAIAMLAVLTGCTTVAPTPPADGGDGGDTTDGGGSGRVTAAIGFEVASGFPQNENAVTFDHDGLTLGFAGGRAMTLGILPLYAEGSRSWMISAETGSARIDLTGQNVVGANFYFVHAAGGSGAQVVWSGSRMLSDPIASIEAPTFAFPNGFVDVVAPTGVIIEALTFSFPEGSPAEAQAAIDALVLTVLE